MLKLFKKIAVVTVTAICTGLSAANTLLGARLVGDHLIDILDDCCQRKSNKVQKSEESNGAPDRQEDSEGLS